MTRRGGHDELELKLELGFEAAAVLESSPLLAGEAIRRDQRAIYFDTPDLALRSQGVSLRIRHDGHQRIQTVKAGSGAAVGLFSRREWEMPVTGDTPVIETGSPVDLLLGDRAGMIAPQFEIAVERRSWMLTEGQSRIELVLDRGAAVVGDRLAPICEVELELQSGTPDTLFDLARRIDRIAPVHLGVLAKSERGYRLLGASPAAVKAEPVVLDGAMSAAEAFQRIAASCLRQYRLNEALLLEQQAPEPLHQARVALRRLRSAISIFKPILGNGHVRHVSEDLRWLAGVMGDARDLDVLVAKAPPGAVRDRLDEARNAAHARVGSALLSKRARRIILETVHWLTTGDWLTGTRTARDRDQPILPFAAGALRRLRRKIRKGGMSLDRLTDEERHEIRKIAKRLRYGAEFFGSLFTGNRQRTRYKPFVAALEALQGHLGALNDLVTAPRLLDRLGLHERQDIAPLVDETRKAKLLKGAARASIVLIEAGKFWT
jgi:triphosphatase